MSSWSRAIRRVFCCGSGADTPETSTDDPIYETVEEQPQVHDAASTLRLTMESVDEDFQLEKRLDNQLIEQSAGILDGTQKHLNVSMKITNEDRAFTSTLSYHIAIPIYETVEEQPQVHDAASTLRLTMESVDEDFQLEKRLDNQLIEQSAGILDGTQKHLNVSMKITNEDRAFTSTLSYHIAIPIYETVEEQPQVHDAASTLRLTMESVDEDFQLEKRLDNQLIEQSAGILDGTQKHLNVSMKITNEDRAFTSTLSYHIAMYSEVTPKHVVNEEGQPGFHMQTVKAAEHLYAIIDGKQKEILGTTYAHIKEIVNAVHECGYFDKTVETVAETEESHIIVEEEQQISALEVEVANVAPSYPPPTVLPVPPAPAVVPAPGYPLRPLPPITLQEVEHAYFSQQYPQQRPISEVIGSQNFFFLQESEIDSPVGTPQPPPLMNQQSPPAPIPTQTYTNQHFVQIPGARVPEPTPIPMPPQPHFSPHPEHAAYPGVPIPAPIPPQQPPAHPQTVPQPPLQPIPQPIPQPVVVEQEPVQAEEQKAPTPVEDKNEDEWKESQSPKHEDSNDRRTQGQGDGQNRFRRYGRGGRGASNGYRGRGNFQNRQNDGYHPRGEYQNRINKDGYQNRQYDGYQNRHKDGYQNRGGNDGYYGNGDTGDSHQQNENGGRDRYNDSNQSYQGGFKSRGRGGPRGGTRGASRPPRTQQYNRKQENVE